MAGNHYPRRRVDARAPNGAAPTGAPSEPPLVSTSSIAESGSPARSRERDMRARILSARPPGYPGAAVHTLALLLALLAQDAQPTPSETIVVEDGRVARTRKELETAILELGYHVKREKDGRVVYRPDVAWHPTIVVDADGFVVLRRSPVRFAVPSTLGPAMRALSWGLCPLKWDICVHAGGQVVSKAKLDARKGEADEATNAQRIAWNDALHDRGQAARLASLPAAMDRLWQEGTPLDQQGAPPLATPLERKAALIEFWASRADTPEGDQVRALVRDFLLYEVSESPWPVTEADRAVARERCDCDPDF
jgi:hypothetical protein